MASFLAPVYLVGLNTARRFVSGRFSGPQAARLMRCCTVLLAALTGCNATTGVPLAEIVVLRKQADQLGSVVSLYPLVDSVRADRLRRIDQLESAGQLDDAVRLAEASLQGFPGDPLIWQMIAELALQQGELTRAVEAAERARTLGPARGALCARSWRVLSLAHALLGNNVEADSAGGQVGDCALLREERY